MRIIFWVNGLWTYHVQQPSLFLGKSVNKEFQTFLFSTLSINKIVKIPTFGVNFFNECDWNVVCRMQSFAGYGSSDRPRRNSTARHFHSSDQSLWVPSLSRLLIDLNWFHDLHLRLVIGYCFKLVVFKWRPAGQIRPARVWNGPRAYWKK